MSDTTWKEQTRLIFARLKGKHANKKCFECPNRNPSWASIPYGIFICANCAGIHRKLGTHLSFVRSTSLDEWSEAQVKRMICGGNEKANAFFRRYNINCSGGRSTVIENKYSSKAAKTYRTNLDNEARVSTLQNAPGTSPKGDTEKGGGDLADLMGGFGLGDKGAAPPKKKPIVAKPKKDPSESLIYKEKKKIEEKGKNLVLKKTGSAEQSRTRTPRRSPKDIKAVPKKRFGSNKKKLKKGGKSTKSSLISMDSDSSDDDSDSDFERQVQAAIAKAKETKAEKEEEKKKELKAKSSSSRSGSNRTTSNSYRNNTNSYNSSISIQEKIKRKANRSGNVTSFSSQDFFDQEDVAGGQDEELRRSKFQSASAIGSDAYFNRPTQGDKSNGTDFNWDDMRYEAAEKARQVTSAASSWIKDLSDKFRSGS